MNSCSPVPSAKRKGRCKHALESSSSCRAYAEQKRTMRPLLDLPTRTASQYSINCRWARRSKYFKTPSQTAQCLTFACLLRCNGRSRYISSPFVVDVSYSTLHQSVCICRNERCKESWRFVFPQNTFDQLPWSLLLFLFVKMDPNIDHVGSCRPRTALARSITIPQCYWTTKSYLNVLGALQRSCGPVDLETLFMYLRGCM